MIRKYVETDLEGVLEAWYAASRIATPFLSEDFLSQEREQIRDLWMPKAETWVFESGTTIRGFIALVGDEVGGIFVHPNAQGEGIGRALMDHALELRGRLILDVFESNPIGRRFYDRYGFRQVGRHVHEPTGYPQLRLEYVR